MLIVMGAMGNGWKYISKRNILEFCNQQYQKDLLLTTTEKTVLVMADIAKSINSNIQVTHDSSEINNDGKMPVL